VWRKILERKRYELTGDWSRLYNGELYDLYSLFNVIRLMKSRRMRWVGHVARIGERRGAYRGFVQEI
jgi:hypothetical protein